MLKLIHVELETLENVSSSSSGGKFSISYKIESKTAKYKYVVSNNKYLLSHRDFRVNKNYVRHTFYIYFNTTFALHMQNVKGKNVFLLFFFVCFA